MLSYYLNRLKIYRLRARRTAHSPMNRDKVHACLLHCPNKSAVSRKSLCTLILTLTVFVSW